MDQVTEPAINAYLEGIRRSGWEGDESLVRFGCLANVTLRVTLGIPDLVFRAIDEGHPLQIRNLERLEEWTEHHSESLEYLLGLAEATGQCIGVVE